MPEVQKPVLEHAAPKANQTPRLDGRLADDSLPESNHAAKAGAVRKTDVDGARALVEVVDEFFSFADRLLSSCEESLRTPQPSPLVCQLAKEIEPEVRRILRPSVSVS